MPFCCFLVFSRFFSRPLFGSDSQGLLFAAIIYCVDAHDTVHWEESLNVLKEVLANVPNVPVLVFCCKSDMEGAKSKADVATFFNLNESRLRFFPAESLAGTSEDGIRQGIAWLEKRLEEGGRD